MLDDFLKLVKDQSSWFRAQVALHHPGHDRHRPHVSAKYERLADGFDRLYAFLENVSPNPNGHSHSESYVGALEEETKPARLNKSAPVPPDLSDLPAELLEQLSEFSQRGEADPVIQVISDHGGSATLDEILIGLYRKTGVVNKRNLLANRLYRMSKRGMISIPPGRKGVYSTDVQPELFKGSAFDEHEKG